MTKEEFLNNINDEVFNCDNDIYLDTKFKELPGWDSMTAILLIDYLLNNFKIHLNNNELENLVTIEDLYKFIK